MKTKRFSKAMLAAQLEQRVAAVAADHKFDLNLGTHQIFRRAQIEHWPLERIIQVAADYGRMRGYESILEDFTQ